MFEGNFVKFAIKSIFATFFALLLSTNFAHSLEFTVSENGKSLGDNNTVLIFGGIQGDEPGAFHAASLLISDYKITRGKIIVAPNLAFDSIIKRSRSVKGDLNRKFAELPKNDPDYETIQRIKNLILLPEVGMVINLHDGWGFYRPIFIDEMKNPKRWGNSSVIDTAEINASKYKDLENIALSTVENVNAKLLDPKHKYHLKNTKTKEVDDTEMLKALTYFVISNNKAAFANEASKNLSVNLRAYYHLVAIENYLKTAGIEFTRDFELSPEGVAKAINKEIHIKLFNNKFLLALDKPRKNMTYIPFPVNKPLNYSTSNEITAIIADKKGFFVQYGNRFQARIKPEFFEFSDAFNDFSILVDGDMQVVPFASKVLVKEYFLVPYLNGVRVNVIGYQGKGNESNVKVYKKMMLKNYSMDSAGKLYRVEFYERRGAGLSQQSAILEADKLIKNAIEPSMDELKKIKEKDKFIGAILVEFE